MEIINRAGIPEASLPAALLNEIAAAMTADFDADGQEFTLTFTKPAEIKRLNKKFRSTDEVTDVLSFPAEGEMDPETQTLYLGDILICFERAQEQAQLSGHPVENEIALLLIHGLLHLFGYDHGTPEDKAEMWALQAEYLERFGIAICRNPGADFAF